MKSGRCRTVVGLAVVLSSSLLRAQVSASGVVAPKKFEVAAIRASGTDNPPFYGYRFSPSGRLTAKHVSVVGMIVMAYKVHPWTISGAPGWADSKNFDIEATVDPEVAAELSTMGPKERGAAQDEMLRSLLEDRFKLKVRHEIRVQSVYAMVVAKSGAKLPPSAEKPSTAEENGLVKLDPSAAAGPMLTMMNGEWRAQRMTMAMWSRQLEGQPEMQRTVLDETGLTGRYDFTFKWARTPDDSGPNLFTALEEQLGLKLVPKKASVDVVVVESVEMPTEN